MPPTALAEPAAPRAEPGARAERDSFLIPSVFGDEPQLQDLRARLAGCLRFELLDLPDAGARGTLLTDMAATGRLLAAEVARRRPAGPVALAGFSFGASMALEVATQLEAAGREVAFLCVLDGPFEPPRVAAPAAPGLLAGPRSLLKSVVVDAAESMDGVRRLVARAASPEAAANTRAEPMRRAMLWHLRNKALRTWTPRPCAAPGLHVSSGEYGPDNRARWAALCPNLASAEVPAVHADLLKGAALDGVVAAVRGAFG